MLCIRAQEIHRFFFLSCVSGPIEGGVAFTFQIGRCGLCVLIPIKEVWPLCLNPSEGDVAFVS